MLLDGNVTRHLCAALLVAWLVPGHFSSAQVLYDAAGYMDQSPKKWEQERERAYNRQQFTKNFRDLQLLGQNLLKEHEANRLTSERLAKDSKSINKCAKTLRSLTALGSLALPLKINKDITTPKQYDESIRRLAKHIWDFAHNPNLQNSKVFDTEQAKRAQSDLLAIIDLSKAIEDKAKGYSSSITQTQ
ncbi:MAG: hypothetical protein ABIP14_07350 [Blastocatellia bacterium]